MVTADGADADLVRPHYLALLGTNALRLDEPTRRRVVSTGRQVDAHDVVRLLESAQWRAVVVGAWFSLAVPPRATEAAVLRAMATSAGSLTAHPLVTVATLALGRDALPSIRLLADQAHERHDGSATFARSAVEHLDGERSDAVTDDDRGLLAHMLAAAERLRSAWT